MSRLTRRIPTAVLVGTLLCFNVNVDVGRAADEAASRWDLVGTAVSEAVAADRLDDAVSVVRSDADSSPDFSGATPRFVATVVQLARQCETHQRGTEAADLYNIAAQAIAKPSDELAASLDRNRRCGIWIAAAKRLTSESRPADALRWLIAVKETAPASLSSTPANRAAEHDPWRVIADEQWLRVGAGAIDQQDFETATSAYRMATESLSGAALATARLGLAWSLTMAGSDDGAAVTSIDHFLTQHSDHADAPSAMLLRITCATRQGNPALAQQTRLELIERYPESPATTQAIAAAVRHASDDWFDDPSQQQLLAFVAAHPQRFLRSTNDPASTIATGLLAAVVTNQPAAESDFAAALLAEDSLTGRAAAETASYVLQQLTTHQRSEPAERIARTWLGALATDDTGVSLAVIEATCRWAGRTNRWEMLADIAAKRSPQLGDEDSLDRVGQLAVARLMAESLVQTGRVQASLPWWEAIVDRGGAEDFPTLLRLAETTVAAGSVAQGNVRLASARAAADVQSHEPQLVMLLAAELEVRQLQFDRGRGLLESVVRSSGADAHLRGRAQWLIGETFFMQGKYSEAIDAYRLVEGISDDPQWIAASLVQAGKSFEQLGRTREAAVCYSTLVSRFGDSDHASGARHRLAALGDPAPESPGVMRR